MKRTAIVLFFFFAVTLFTIHTGDAMEHEGIQKELLANIQTLWQAWKDQDPEPFKKWLAQDGIAISTQGVMVVSDFVQQIAGKQCQVKSFSIDLESARLSKLGENIYMITYRADQDATCMEMTLPTPVTVSEVWLKENGVWKGQFYQETPLVSK